MRNSIFKARELSDISRVHGFAGEACGDDDGDGASEGLACHQGIDEGLHAHFIEGVQLVLEAPHVELVDRATSGEVFESLWSRVHGGNTPLD
ncbi:MAG: hypothetical protein ACNA8W_02830 [Bradymonadaceae bacterium]